MALFNAYIPTLSSVRLIDKQLVSDVMHYYYFVTYEFTPIATSYTDTTDSGTNVGVGYNSVGIVSIDGLQGFNSVTDEMTSETLYVDATAGSGLSFYAQSRRADNDDLIGDYTTSYVYFVPSEPVLTINIVHPDAGASYRYIYAPATNVDWTNTKMSLKAYYYDTLDDIKVLDFGEIEPDLNHSIYTMTDYNNYNASHLYYEAKIIQYNTFGDQEFKFESDAVTETYSPYLQPYTPELYGVRDKDDSLVFRHEDGFDVQWIFRSRDGSPQQSFECVYGNEIITKTGTTEQYCRFEYNEVPSGRSFIVLNTFGKSSDPATKSEPVLAVPDIITDTSFTYDYAQHMIKVRTFVDEWYGAIDIEAYIAIIDPDGDTVWSGTTKSVDGLYYASKDISIYDIKDYSGDQIYTLYVKIYSNILEGFVFETTDTLPKSGLTVPDAPSLDVEVVDDYCLIDVGVDEYTYCIDLVCELVDDDRDDIHILNRYIVNGEDTSVRFNVPPLDAEFNVYCIAYNAFFNASDKTTAGSFLIDCSDTVYINYDIESNAPLGDYGDMYNKYKIKINAGFSKDVQNTVAKYDVIGKYDYVIKPSGGAARTMSISGNVVYSNLELDDLETLVRNGIECAVRLPHGMMYYCYMTSAGVKKDRGIGNASVDIGLSIDSSLKTIVRRESTQCEATLLYVKKVLAELL